MLTKEKILELRNAGYTWNQIDQMLLPESELHRRKGKIVSKAFKFAKANNIEGAFTKQVIGAYTATQIVVPLRSFNPNRKIQAAATEMIDPQTTRVTMADLGL